MFVGSKISLIGDFNVITSNIHFALIKITVASTLVRIIIIGPHHAHIGSSEVINIIFREVIYIVVEKEHGIFARVKWLMVTSI